MKSIARTALFLTATLVLSARVAKSDTISASLTASLFTELPPSGTNPVFVDLSGISTPSQNEVIGNGYSIQFSNVDPNDGVVQGTINVHAVPVAGVVGSTPEYLTGGFGSPLTTDILASGNYLATGLGTITISFDSPQTSLALLWGSVDPGNTLTFNDALGFVVTGRAVAAAAGPDFVPNSQGPGGSAYVVVNTTTPFTTVTAASNIASFEFAGIAAAGGAVTPVPEPPTRLLLLSLGFGLIGARALSRRWQKSPGKLI